MKNSLSKNFIYNLVYQILVVIVPIVLIPYLSRVFGPDGLGEFSFSYSIVMYFSYFALLGVQLYGSKTIAIKRDNEVELIKSFWEILVLKIVTSLISIVIFYILLFIYPNKILFSIQGILLLANLLDISWFYTGLEKFKSIVIRNSIIKISSLILIMTFVKEPSQVWLYTLILVAAEVISQLILWVDAYRLNIFKHFKEIKVNFKPFKHFKNMLMLFLPQAIILLYTTINITMLGLLANTTETGYFDMSAKIVNTILVVTTSLGIVIIPRMSKLHVDNNQEKIKYNLAKSINISTYLAYPLMIGLFVLSNAFVPWFFGDLFIDASIVMMIYTFKIILVTLSNVVGLQYMIPTDQNKAFLKSVSIGAVVTVILNLILIPLYGALGAVIASLLSEVLVTGYQIYLTRKQVDFADLIAHTYKSFLSAILMGLLVFILYIYTYDNIVSLINFNETISNGIAILTLTAIGGFSYLTFNLILGNNVQKDIITRTLKIVKIKK